MTAPVSDHDNMLGEPSYDLYFLVIVYNKQSPSRVL